jgi:hypothetical protein
MNPAPVIWGEVFQKNPQSLFSKDNIRRPDELYLRVAENNTVIQEIVLDVINKMRDVIFDFLEG